MLILFEWFFSVQVYILYNRILSTQIAYMPCFRNYMYFVLQIITKERHNACKVRYSNNDYFILKKTLALWIGLGCSAFSSSTSWYQSVVWTFVICTWCSVLQQNRNWGVPANPRSYCQGSLDKNIENMQLGSKYINPSKLYIWIVVNI